MTKIHFTAKGVCLGNLWGGGEGSYPARKYSNDNLKKLIAEIKKDVKSGGIDSGMGFQSMIGALMAITTITTKTIEGKDFINEEEDCVLFGKLTETQKEFLDDSLFSFAI